MKKLILVLAFLFWASVAWGATYYVKWDATGSGNGSSWPNAYTTISAAVAAHNAVGDVIEISGGESGHTYAETVNAQYNRVFTIQGSTESGHSGLVTIDGTGTANNTLRIDKQIINNLQLINTDGSSNRRCLEAIDNYILNDVIIGELNSDRSSITDKRLFTLSGSSKTGTFNRCIFAGAGTVQTGAIGAGNSVVINYSVITDNWGHFEVGGNLTLNNVTFIGNGQTSNSPITNSGSGNVVCNNTIFAANVLTNSNKHVVRNAGTGSNTFNNCVLLPHPLQAATYNYQGTQNNSIKASPKFLSARREAYVSFVIDDFSSLSDFSQFATIANAKGVKVGFALSYINNMTAGNWTTLQGLVSSGNEILNHTMSHPNLTLTTGLSIVGPANSTVDISVDNSDPNPTNWTGTIICKVSGSPVLVVDVSAAGSYFSPKLASVRINDQIGGSGWAASYSGPSGGDSLAAALTSVAGVDVTGAGANFAWNQSKYLYYEVGWAKKLIEQNIGGGYVCKMFAYPGGSFDATIKAYLYNSAVYPSGTNIHIGARSLGTSTSWTLSNDYKSGTGSLAGLQVYEIYSTHPSTISGNSPSDATITETWSAWASWLKFIGGIGMTYSHDSTIDGATYYSPANLGKIIDALLSAGITIITPTQAVETVRDSGLWSDADANGTRWVRIFSDQSDYRLKKSSPCRNAGVNVGLTEDITGRAVPKNGIPDIGAYESWSKVVPFKKKFIPIYNAGIAPVNISYLLDEDGSYLLFEDGSFWIQ